MTTVRTPAHIAPYVEVLGEELALTFFLTFGGGYLYLSNNPTAASSLAREVGRDRAIKLTEALGGAQNIRIPIPKPWLAAVMAARGRSTNSIAQTLHISDVTVRRMIGTRDERQADLFGADPK